MTLYGFVRQNLGKARKMFKYSIIVAVYNLENYIEESLNSLLHQTYRNIEVLVVDDGSVDNSVKICRTISGRDSRMRLITSGHGGVSVARNTGLNNATGDYVFFVDGDDFIEKDYIEKADRILSKSNTDVMITNHYYYYDNNTKKHTDKVMFPITDAVRKKEASLLDHILENSYSMPCYVCFNIYKRDYLVKNKCSFTENISWGEDSDFFLQVMLRNPAYEVADIKYYYYRRHRKGSSADNVTTRKILDRLCILRKWCRYLDQDEEGHTMLLLRRWLSREYYLTFPFCLPWYGSNIDYKIVAEKIVEDRFIWEKHYPGLGKLVSFLGLKNAVIVMKIKEYSKLILGIK